MPIQIKNKTFKFNSKDKKGKIIDNGKMEIKSLVDGIPELYFYGDITGSTFDNWQDEDKCPQDVSDFLSQLEGATDINIYINSGGGDSFAGMAIYNMLKRNSANKHVYVDGIAASAASIIAMAGDLITIPNTAELMIHNAWTIAMGNANDFRDLAAFLDKADQAYLNAYVQNATDGVTADQIKQMMDNTTWMTGAEAAKVFKNIDVQDIQVAACAESQYYSHYKNLPEGLKQKKNSNSNGNYVTREYLDSKISEVIKAMDVPKEPENPPVPQNNGKEIEQLKAKLALECEL